MIWRIVYFYFSQKCAAKFLIFFNNYIFVEFMGPVKEEKLSWRELKEKKKKWKAERKLQMLEKEEKLKHASKLKEQTKNIGKDKVIQTCSIAIPGSIMDNAQSHELRTYLAGQIARAACIYKIDEIIVYDDLESVKNLGVVSEDVREVKRCCTQLARLLQYLECPQYLRKSFFPIHHDLQHAGLMNPLDAPHHLRQDEVCLFREGVVSNKAVKSSKGSYVNIGLLKEALISEKLTPGLRVTVKLLPNENENSKRIKGTVVSPNTPVHEQNLYWGYSVRIAKCLSDVFCKSPYSDGYDLSIGTSDKGVNVDTVKKKCFRQFKHILIVFGGVKGLEDAVENDDNINTTDPSLLFDHYLNICPSQGSRTIRTEEAVLITLAELRKFVLSHK